MARAGLAASPPLLPPRPLRPFVRFSRLSDRALSTVRRVLDEDEGFRRHVCSSIDLAGLVEDLDEPTLLYLRRPAGWESALERHAETAAAAAAADAGSRVDATAARRLEAATAARAQAEAETASLRALIADLRAQIAEERHARRTAESDRGRLRKQVAELERDRLTVAEVPGAAAALEAAVAAAEERAARAEAHAREAHERAEAAEAVAAATATGSDLGRPHDLVPAPSAAAATAVADAVAAVGALADALARASRELVPGATAPPSPPQRPQAGARRRRSGRRPVPLPPAVFEDAPEAVDHLLRVPGAVVLVDGYNVTLGVRAGLGLADQRRWLLDAAAGLAARTGATFEVVFDGEAPSIPADGPRRLGVRSRFTDSGVDADDVLLELVERLPPEVATVVVSDDRRVRDGARRRGANVVTAGQLVDALRR